MNFDSADGLLDADELSFLNNILESDNDLSDFDLPKISSSSVPSFQEDAINHVPLSKSPRSPVPSGSHNVKCTGIYLGGTGLDVGVTVFPDQPCFCSNLSCLSCDHIVLRFPDARWKKETNYLFLRNNYPNQVDRNLLRAPGWCAFCCQCTFREERTTTRLSTFATNWVCRGHY